MTRRPSAAGLEREIRAIGGKIDSLAATAINPETFERIRRQTEEVRNLLASAALRTRAARAAGAADRRARRSRRAARRKPRAALRIRRDGRAARRSLPADRTLHASGGARLDRAASGTDRGAARSGNCSPYRSRRHRSGPVRRLGAPHRRRPAIPGGAPARNGRHRPDRKAFARVRRQTRRRRPYRRRCAGPPIDLRRDQGQARPARRRRGRRARSSSPFSTSWRAARRGRVSGRSRSDRDFAALA